MSTPAAKYDEAAIRNRISKAKLKLMMMKETVFFSTLLCLMNIKICSQTIGTACTDGLSIWFNPFFIEKLTQKQLLGLMMHELLHTVFEHVTRFMDKKYDRKLLNIAGDHYINLYLLRRGFELPPGGYADPKYNGWSTMEIYKDLVKQQKQDPTNPNAIPGAGKFEPDLKAPPANTSPKEVKEKITSNIVKAATQAKVSNDYGSVPGVVDRMLQKILNPKLPWYTILQNYMTVYAKEDYSFRRPNRRYMPDHYLPCMHSEAMGQMTAGCDVSASMDAEDLERIWAEIRYIWSTLAPEKLRLMTFDTEVHLNKTYSIGDTLDVFKLKGGGGTNIQPLIDSVRKEQPKLVLIFTDGYFRMPDMNGIFSDIFWIILNNPGFKPPKGTVIHY